MMSVSEIQLPFRLILDPFHSRRHGLCCMVKLSGSVFSVELSEIVGTWSEAVATLSEATVKWSEAMGIWSEAAATLVEAVGKSSEAAGILWLFCVVKISGSAFSTELSEVVRTFGVSCVIKLSGSAFSVELLGAAGTLDSYIFAFGCPKIGPGCAITSE